MPDQQSDPGILQYLLPVIAGVASAATPGLARGVSAGLGTYGALQESYRLKQALNEAKQQKAVAAQNFGRLADYYSGARGPAMPASMQRPALYESDTAIAPGDEERVQSFIQQHNLPKDSQISPEQADFLKSLFPIAPHDAVAGLQTYLTRERLPSTKDVLGVGDLRPGQKLTGKTQEGFGFELQGKEAPDAHIRTEVRGGFKWDVGVDPRTGKELFARNTGEQFSQPDPRDFIDKTVTTDPRTGDQTLVGYDKRLGPQKGLKYSFSIGGHERPTFGRLLALRSKGQTTGDTQVDALSQSDASDLYRQQGLLAQFFGGGPAPATTPAPVPGGTADERLKAKVGLK
jgi:hypothetical protein